MIPASLTRTRRFIAALTAIAATVTVAHTAIFAPIDYTPLVPLADNDGRFSVSTISHPDDRRQEAWNEALYEAVAIWNAQSPHIHITVETDSANSIVFTDLPRPSQGMYIPTASCLLGTECNFTIYLDSVPFNYHPATISRRGQYILAHELGHALGLNDRYRETHDSIMNKSLRYKTQEPTRLDVLRVEYRIQTASVITGG